ncbi:DNA-3-methyladenine glycosylase I [Persicobacter diffluens]
MENRCPWAEVDDLYRQYHDQEWGKPEFDDQKLFEMLCLEGAQAGISWHIILKKRDNYRKAFLNFDPDALLETSPDYRSALVQDAGIIRNKLKINAVFTNALAYKKVKEEFGSFSEYIWSFVNHSPIINHFQSLEEVPAETEISVKMSKDLKKRGFKFVGPKIIYAYMQAVGMVNDHLTSCPAHALTK